MRNRIHTRKRPYLLSFDDTGEIYPLSAERAQRVLDANQDNIIELTDDHLVIENNGRCSLMAADLGDYPAFLIGDRILKGDR